MTLLDRLAMEMIAYDKGDPKRIHHFLKVHDFARLIGVAEGWRKRRCSVWRQRHMSTTSASTRGVPVRPE